MNWRKINILHKAITDLNELNGYKHVFKNYIRDNRLLSRGCLSEVETMQNLFFSYNLSNDELRRCEDYMDYGDYMILFSINLYNNSLSFKIYGRIDVKKIKEIREKINKILDGEKYSLLTCNILNLYKDQKLMGYELNFYGERCTPLLKQKILNRIENTKMADTVLGEAVEPLEVIKAVDEDKSIICLNKYVIIPETGEINIQFNLFASRNKIDSIKDELDALMICFAHYTDFYRVSYLPFTGMDFCRYEIVYTNLISNV